ncbi:MAG: hypothetical protein ACREJ2_10750, partial [Planctomycetota bacterium]
VAPAAPAAPRTASEALARADQEFQSGAWIEAFADYAAACHFSADEAEQDRFENDAAALARHQLHALACLGQMAWIYRTYPTPDAALPVLEPLVQQLDREPALRRRAQALELQVARDAGRVDLETHLRLAAGYVTDWQVLGPIWPETELEPPGEVTIADEPVNTALAPLRLKRPTLDLTQPISARGSTVTWRRLPAIALDGRIPLHRLVEPAPGRRALLATWIKVPAPQDVHLILRANTPFRIYLDYVLAGAFQEATGSEAAELDLPLRLHEGWNRLLVESESPAGEADDGTANPAAAQLLANRPGAGWWFSCRFTQPSLERIVDAANDHPIDDAAEPESGDFEHDVRPWLKPTLPDFPNLPDDPRTWSDVQRDLLVAWMRAAADAAGGSRATRAQIAAQVTDFQPAMKDDRRFFLLLARLTPAGLAGFQFDQPQQTWLDPLRTRFDGGGVPGAWLAARARLEAFHDVDGACAALGAIPDLSDAHPYDVRLALKAVVLAQAGRATAARPLLDAFDRRYPADAADVPCEIWYRLACLRRQAGDFAGCQELLQRIPATAGHLRAQELWLDLFQHWDFGQHSADALDRCRAYLPAAPFDEPIWWRFGCFQTLFSPGEEAEANLTHALLLDPESLDHWRRLQTIARRDDSKVLAERCEHEIDARDTARRPDWRMPPSTLSVADMRAMIATIEAPPPVPAPAPAPRSSHAASASPATAPASAPAPAASPAPASVPGVSPPGAALT